MKRHLQLILLMTIALSTMFSSCAKRVVKENDHKHPHIKKRHPHERPIQPASEIKVQ